MDYRKQLETQLGTQQRNDDPAELTSNLHHPADEANAPSRTDQRIRPACACAEPDSVSDKESKHASSPTAFRDIIATPLERFIGLPLADGGYDHSDETPIMPNSRRSKSDSKKRLRKHYSRLVDLRQNVLDKRAEVRYDYQLFSNEFAEALNRYGDLVHALPESVAAQHDYVLGDNETLAQRAERITQLEGLLERPEKELAEADADFLVAAEDVLRDIKRSDAQRRLATHARDEVVTSSAANRRYPLLLEMYNARRADVQILIEQIIDLDWDHEEALIQRDLQADRDERPDLSDDQFETAYSEMRHEIESQLARAESEATALEAGCLAQGFDLTGQAYAIAGPPSPAETQNMQAELDKIPWLEMDRAASPLGRRESQDLTATTLPQLDISDWVLNVPDEAANSHRYTFPNSAQQVADRTIFNDLRGRPISRSV